MANNHFVPRFLTEPWEIADRFLVYHHRVSDAVRRKSSRALLAHEDMNDDATERIFSELETRAALARSSIVPSKTVSASVPVVELQEASLDALIALSMLQLHRSGIALANGFSWPPINQHGAESATWTRELAAAARSQWAFLLVVVPVALMFPAGGFFVVPDPSTDQAVLLAFPMLPNVVLVRLGTGNDPGAVCTLLDPARAFALSFGSGQFSTYAIFPKGLAASKKHQELLGIARTARRYAGHLRADRTCAS